MPMTRPDVRANVLVGKKALGSDMSAPVRRERLAWERLFVGATFCGSGFSRDALVWNNIELHTIPTQPSP